MSANATNGEPKWIVNWNNGSIQPPKYPTWVYGGGGALVLSSRRVLVRKGISRQLYHTSSSYRRRKCDLDIVPKAYKRS